MPGKGGKYDLNVLKYAGEKSCEISTKKTDPLKIETSQ